MHRLARSRITMSFLQQEPWLSAEAWQANELCSSSGVEWQPAFASYTGIADIIASKLLPDCEAAAAAVKARNKAIDEVQTQRSKCEADKAEKGRICKEYLQGIVDSGRQPTATEEGLFVDYFAGRFLELCIAMRLVIIQDLAAMYHAYGRGPTKYHLYTHRIFNSDTHFTE